MPLLYPPVTTPSRYVHVGAGEVHNKKSTSTFDYKFVFTVVIASVFAVGCLVLVGWGVLGSADAPKVAPLLTPPADVSVVRPADPTMGLSMLIDGVMHHYRDVLDVSPCRAFDRMYIWNGSALTAQRYLHNGILQYTLPPYGDRHADSIWIEASINGDVDSSSGTVAHSDDIYQPLGVSKASCAIVFASVTYAGWDAYRDSTMGTGLPMIQNLTLELVIGPDVEVIPEAAFANSAYPTIFITNVDFGQATGLVTIGDSAFLQALTSTASHLDITGAPMLQSIEPMAFLGLGTFGGVKLTLSSFAMLHLDLAAFCSAGVDIVDLSGATSLTSITMDGGQGCLPQLHTLIVAGGDALGNLASVPNAFQFVHTALTCIRCVVPTQYAPDSQPRSCPASGTALPTASSGQSMTYC